MAKNKPLTLAEAGALGGRSTSRKKVEAVRRNLKRANAVLKANIKKK